MSDTPAVSVPDTTSPDYNKYLKIQYIALLLGTFLFPIALIAVICAHYYRAEMPALEAAHARRQIRTFWFGMLGTIVSLILSFFMIGILTGFLVWVWAVVRYVRGFLALKDGKYPPGYEPEATEDLTPDSAE